MPTFHPATTPIYPLGRDVIVYFTNGLVDGKNAYRIEPGVLIDEERGVVVSDAGGPFLEPPVYWADIPLPHERFPMPD